MSKEIADICGTVIKDLNRIRNTGEYVNCNDLMRSDSGTIQNAVELLNQYKEILEKDTEALEQKIYNLEYEKADLATAFDTCNVISLEFLHEKDKERDMREVFEKGMDEMNALAQRHGVNPDDYEKISLEAYKKAVAIRSREQIK